MEQKKVKELTAYCVACCCLLMIDAVKVKRGRREFAVLLSCALHWEWVGIQKQVFLVVVTLVTLVWRHLVRKSFMCKWNTYNCRTSVAANTMTRKPDIREVITSKRPTISMELSNEIKPN